MRRRRSLIIIFLCLALAGGAALPAAAYTEEEKQMVKDALAAYGYSPDWAGLNQAYADYMAGNLDLSAYGIAPYDSGGYTPDTEGYTPQTEPDTQASSQSDTETPSGQEGNGASGQEDLQKLEGSISREALSIKLGETVALADYARLTLTEISFGPQVYPPITNGDYETYRCKGEGMEYIDLVFEVENLTQEDLAVDGFLNFTVSGGEKEYPGEMLLGETGSGTDLSAGVRIRALKKGRVHCVAAVPKTMKEYTVKLLANGQNLTFSYREGDPMTVEEELVLDTPVRAENLAEVCLTGMERTAIDGTPYLKADLRVTNLQKYQAEWDWLCGGSLWLGGERYPGYLSLTGDGDGLETGVSLEAGEEREVWLMVKLPEEEPAEEKPLEKKETWELSEAGTEEASLKIFLDGNWYACSASEMFVKTN